ncbi:hypothetical protein FPOAC1_001888 [Fusarium poae]|uniref:hypothetical protein n=1 Tax=Fusarium poae TaxID=36050 RepID=UPI001CEA5306|nr:hypothetical protein FPOAC1_001888 [Fusarium poae]KAG8675893.1 hypothetical protein FPOAC1_001888 [Fusarium poae]
MSLSDGIQSALHSKAAVTINHLPNEVLVQIYHYLSDLQDPVLPIEIHDNLPPQELQYGVRQYNDLILTQNYTAVTLRLVSRRFNHLFQQFIIRNIVIVQSKLFLLQERTETPVEMQSSRQFMEAENLAKSMERLRNLMNLNPELGKRCKSLCLAYKQVKVPVRIPGQPDANEGWIPPEGLVRDLDIYNRGEIFEGFRHEFQLERTIIPDPLWLNNNIYSCFSQVTDVQLHSNHFGNVLPDMTPALSSFPNLTTLRVTGKVDYASLIEQLVEILTPSSALQTLDLSRAPADYWSHGFARIAETLMARTAPFTRLLTGPDTCPRILESLVAWPRRLERLVLQTSFSQMNLNWGRGVQEILDGQKDCLTHLRFQGKYELGLTGFDLRDFPCLEHLALDSATISNRDPRRRDGSTLPDLEQRILAPRLRSLLWVMPAEQPESGDFFGPDNQSRLENVLFSLGRKRIEYQESGKEWTLKRIWLQTLAEPLESLPADAQDSFASHLKWISRSDQFCRGPEGPTLQHVPLPKGGMGANASPRGSFSQLDEVWSWDDHARTI